MIFDRRRYGKDNYVYLLADGADAALVDPGDAAAALALASAHGLRPRFVLHTHGHPDHTGGTAEVVRQLGARVLGGGGDARWYRPDEDLAGAGELALGALRLRVHPAPGHTPGSVLYAWEGRLLTGDTLFWGGAGNCRHGGDPARLAETFLGVVAPLDGGLRVYPGHDYAEANLPFALDLEPGNAAARAQLEAARAARARGEEPAATTLADERAANPFLRAEELRPELLRRGLPCRDAREAFVALRGLRDAWRG
ncbi:MBL fold metallo-hydrolase [Anaeromyxobacter diazotrophicus]|uniref:MBL fold metallo-hydrolase n=1 Tax=Anaeromyxobacter diazotrophicus TaxID=2590199 RepID=UPI001590D1A5|nr:hydroxyacylglutathione hydrolase C-terminal domain-containing protein [Anaeromyxobacter diazotrophicus]